ncbi:LacI family DNA-binding transcriptional regulator [Liquorilactobacillus oeni]|uniref:LacI family transcriptional regulator n=1 Tax=Liquorilactobacillus oeni DSM 19972 TaxID=1423777 RepID=A0A0R1MBJ7_9LACO|nr:LacI family DNA-binding transcriptional regulator [Liquorilactobacillus oeni]KRL05382.1 LacI family transcriptional regulator [Liquorilactobacillus oeni DSM 19972]
MGVTIKDIAKQANVSIATVSRILSNKTEFNSKSTIRKVKRIAKELGYSKNTAAVELVTRSSKVLAVVITATKTNFSMQIIDGIHEEAYKHGLNVIIIYAGENDPKRQYEAIKTITERSVKGILLLALDLSQESQTLLIQSQIPYIFLSISNNQGMPYIDSDNSMIGYLAADYLIEKGHKKIGFAGLDTVSLTAKNRISGYKKALAKHNLTCDPEWIVNGLFTYDDGVNAMKQYGTQPEVTAVIAGSDLVGIGLMNQAGEFGLKVPEDLAIVTIDGTDLCEIVHPRLTSITQSFYKIGVMGVLYLINYKKQNAYKKLTESVLKVRESS